MDKYNFARLIGLLTSWGMRNLDVAEIAELDNFWQHVPVKNNVDYKMVDELILQFGPCKDGRKIEAIKAYRLLTGLGLKESKDAIERVS